MLITDDIADGFLSVSNDHLPTKLPMDQPLYFIDGLYPSVKSTMKLLT